MKNTLLRRLALNSNINAEDKAVFLLIAYSADVMSPLDIAYILNISLSRATTACATLFYFGFVEEEVTAAKNKYYYVRLGEKNSEVRN